MQPWFRVLGIPFEEHSVTTDLDTDRDEWYTDFTVPAGQQFTIAPLTREQWRSGQY